jgi:very-short-patch-repair endonuclease
MKRIEFLERAREVHGYKYVYPSLNEKVILSDKIDVEYNGVRYNQTIVKHLMGRCPEKISTRHSTEDFISKAIKVWGEKYDYSLVDYKNALDPVKILYRGIVYEQRPTSHLEGMAPEFRKNEESIIRDLMEQNDFKGIREIKDFLKKFKIEFLQNHMLGKIEFDFYIPSMRVCIEFDGIYHFQPIEELGGLKTYDRVRLEEKIKSDYCEDNYIDLVKIKYDQIDNIYMILWGSLKNKI